MNDYHAYADDVKYPVGEESPSYWTFECPHCGGEALNGDPKTATHFRGSTLCRDCDRTSSAIGGKKKKESYAVRAGDPQAKHSAADDETKAGPGRMLTTDDLRRLAKEARLTYSCPHCGDDSGVEPAKGAWFKGMVKCLACLKLFAAARSGRLKKADEAVVPWTKQLGELASIPQRLVGGPNPVTATLLGAGLGVGGGYLAGKGLEAAGVADKDSHKRLAILGGLAGAAPGAVWGAVNAGTPEAGGGGFGGLLSGWPFAKTSSDVRASLRDAAKRIRDECGALLSPDYGDLYWDAKTGTAFWNGADGDERGVDRKIKAILETVPGVKNARYECEYIHSVLEQMEKIRPVEKAAELYPPMPPLPLAARGIADESARRALEARDRDRDAHKTAARAPISFFTLEIPREKQALALEEMALPTAVGAGVGLATDGVQRLLGREKLKDRLKLDLAAGSLPVVKGLYDGAMRDAREDGRRALLEEVVRGSRRDGF